LRSYATYNSLTKTRIRSRFRFSQNNFGRGGRYEKINRKIIAQGIRHIPDVGAYACSLIGTVGLFLLVISAGCSGGTYVQRLTQQSIKAVG